MTAPRDCRRCLLVEDEALVAMLIEDMLGDIGYSVTLASEVEEALNNTSSGEFDCAILDVNLKGRTSFAVADELVARGIPFAFATGYGIDGIEARFDGVPTLQKPFSMSDLQDVLSSLHGH